MEKPYNKYYNSSVQSKASNKYRNKSYDRLELAVYKGEKDLIKAYASSLGMSVNNYIRSLLVADGVLPEVPKENKE